jgi:hypothetical protein
MSPPPITDEVDRLHRQLAEIHAIGVAQLAECVHWWHSTPPPNPVRARTGWQGCDVTLFVIRKGPLPPTEFSPEHWQVRHVGVHRTHIMTSPADGGNTAVTLGSCWLGCPAVARAMSNYHSVSRNQLALSKTPPRSYVASPLSMPSAIRCRKSIMSKVYR